MKTKNLKEKIMINALIKIALAKGIKASDVKDASNELGAGEHHIDTLVRVKGTLKKGDDYEQVQHMKVDQWGMIAVLLSKLNGVTVESVVREINGVDKDAVTLIKKQAQEAMDKVKAPASVMTSGKVTTALTFEAITDKVELAKEAVVEEVEEAEAIEEILENA
jgi:hypothetical protein